jgi:hypothetical protein
VFAPERVRVPLPILVIPLGTEPIWEIFPLTSRCAPVPVFQTLFPARTIPTANVCRLVLLSVMLVPPFNVNRRVALVRVKERAPSPKVMLFNVAEELTLRMDEEDAFALVKIRSEFCVLNPLGLQFPALKRFV